jgi:hypothetical protein
MPPPANLKARQSILAYLDDRAVRSFGEVREAVPQLSESAVRSIVHKLITDCEVDVIRMGDDSRFVCYRRAESRRPFLLGQFWQKAFPVAEMEAAA